MFDRRLWLLSALTLAFFSAARANAENFRPCEDTAGDDSDITYILGKGSASWWKQPCKTEECRAIHDLSCAAVALSRTFHPNFMAFHTPRDGELLQDQARHTLLALGREHPRRIPLYCKLLARVAPNVTGERNAGGYDWNAYYLTTFAIHLDRPGNHCLANVIAAVPDTPAAQASMQEWAIPCLDTMGKCQADLDQSMR